MPADCVILQASSTNGQAFTQTDAIDGERNFKSKTPLLRGQQDLVNLMDERKVRMFIPKPTNNVYDFKGSIDFDYGVVDGASAEEINNNQFIPRGSVIKNTGVISAMVVYTGLETKLMQNLG